MINEFFEQNPALVLEYDLLVGQSTLVSLCLLSKVFISRKGLHTKVIMLGGRDQ